MKAKGLGMIAVHFCFQLNEVMIMRLNACLIFLLLYFVVFCFEALLSKIQKAARHNVMGRYESNPNSFVDIVRFVGVVIAYNSVLGQLAVCGVAALSFCKCRPRTGAKFSWSARHSAETCVR